MDVNGIIKNIKSQVEYNDINLSQTNEINLKSKSVDIKSDEKSRDIKNMDYDDKGLDETIKKLNKSLESEKIHAEYSKHEQLDRMMIKIVDDDTDEVVLEIPKEKILNMVASMLEQAGLIDDHA
jgi:flagellar protein FlaG